MLYFLDVQHKPSFVTRVYNEVIGDWNQAATSEKSVIYAKLAAETRSLPSSENTRVLPRTQTKHPVRNFAPIKKTNRRVQQHAALSNTQETSPRGARELTGGKGTDSLVVYHFQYSSH